MAPLELETGISKRKPVFSCQKVLLDLLRVHVEICGYNLIGEHKSGMPKELYRKEIVSLRS